MQSLLSLRDIESRAFGATRVALGFPIAPPSGLRKSYYGQSLAFQRRVAHWSSSAGKSGVCFTPFRGSCIQEATVSRHLA